jgi:hypothetical protein
MAKGKVLAHSSVYIDPGDCDSKVSYKIIQHDESESGKTYVSCTVELADCSRTISWYFADKDGLEKIDAALAQLKAFRKDFVKFKEKHGKVVR